MVTITVLVKILSLTYYCNAKIAEAAWLITLALNQALPLCTQI